jgi:hypothetical protein
MSAGDTAAVQRSHLFQLLLSPLLRVFEASTAAAAAAIATVSFAVATACAGPASWPSLAMLLLMVPAGVRWCSWMQQQLLG